MEIYTLNVGQGQFVVVTGDTEALIVDTHVPISTKQEVEYVKGALSKILAGKKLVGLIVTGFDSDHFSIVGLTIILNKYRPDWIMYPRYFKETDCAKECFAFIDEKKIRRVSIILADATRRFFYKLSNEFYFEVFSPHPADMDSSNNCSIVCKVVERSSGRSYLVTGDTEIGRWESIVTTFGASVSSDVLAAPHHGSKGATTSEMMKMIRPLTVLISAGVGNQFGHPHDEALLKFRVHTDQVWSTSWGDGQSLRTVLVSGADPKTYKFLA